MTDQTEALPGGGSDLLVTSGCQSAAIAAALGGMLPGHRVMATPTPEAEDVLMGALGGAAVWATSLPEADVAARMQATGSRARVVRIPLVYFPAFHPDILHIAGPDGRPLRSAAGPMSSALVLWGWKRGASEDEIRSWFRPEIYAALGYTALWDSSLELLREIFATSDLDLSRWLLALAPQGVFMLIDNHPTVGALVGLARLVGEQLGADPALVAVDWARLVPDGLLATSTVWPVYPGVAETLGVVGGHVWRADNGRLLGLDAFVSETLAGYRHLDPADVTLPGFRNDHLFAETLGDIPAGVR